MEETFVDRLLRSFSLEMPYQDSMDDYLDFILPLIKPWGEDLNEVEFYMQKPWMEIRDNEDFHEAVLHFYNDEGEYLVSVDGNIYQGSWSIVEMNNKLILERPYGGTMQRELFDLAFMNADFFVLKKHGDQKKMGFNKYFLLGRESLVKNLEWRDVMELMFNRYRNNSQIVTFVVIFVIIVAVVLVFSFF